MHAICTIPRQKNPKLFWGGCTAPTQTPRQLGRGTPPFQTPPLRRLRRLDNSRLRRSTFAPPNENPGSASDFDLRPSTVSTESENPPVCLLLAFRCRGVFYVFALYKCTFTYLLLILASRLHGRRQLFVFRRTGHSLWIQCIMLHVCMHITISKSFSNKTQTWRIAWMYVVELFC